MKRVILVRHGATEWNEAGRLQGHHDVPLSSLGQQQAQLLADREQRQKSGLHPRIVALQDRAIKALREVVEKIQAKNAGAA